MKKEGSHSADYDSNLSENFDELKIKISVLTHIPHFIM